MILVCSETILSVSDRWGNARTAYNSPALVPGKSLIQELHESKALNLYKSVHFCALVL